jgi:hypothetical protein
MASGETTICECGREGCYDLGPVCGCPCHDEPARPSLPEEAKPEPGSRADRLFRYLINPCDHLLDKSPYGDLVMFSEAAAAIRVLEGKLAEAMAARSVEHKGWLCL